MHTILQPVAVPHPQFRLRFSARSLSRVSPRATNHQVMHPSVVSHGMLLDIFELLVTGKIHRLVVKCSRTTEDLAVVSDNAGRSGINCRSRIRLQSCPTTALRHVSPCSRLPRTTRHIHRVISGWFLTPSSPNSTMVDLTKRLPVELLVGIFGHVSTPDILRFKQVESLSLIRGRIN